MQVALRAGFKAQPPSVPTVTEGLPPPLHYLLDAGLGAAGDPEKDMGKWIKDGVPLGISLPIGANNGLPPDDRASGRADPDTIERTTHPRNSNPRKRRPNSTGHGW